MESIISEVLKQLGLPGAVGFTFLICIWLVTRANTTKSDAQSNAINATAVMASQSQAEAFKKNDLLLAATEQLAKLEIRVAQLETEGAQKDTKIAELQMKLSEVQGTVATLEQQLQSERTEKEAVKLENDVMRSQISTLEKQIVLLQERLNQLGAAELRALAQEVEMMETVTPVLDHPNKPKEAI